MKDSELFSKKKITISNGKIRKIKYLLREKYQKQALKETLKISKKLRKNRRIRKVWIGGSVVKQELGKYLKKWNERNYSDIDLYVVASETHKLKNLGLIKRLYKSGADKYFRLSVMGDNGEPLKILDRFQIDVWLMSPISFSKDLKKFPDLFDKVIEVK